MYSQTLITIDTLIYLITSGKKNKNISSAGVVGAGVVVPKWQHHCRMVCRAYSTNKRTEELAFPS